jgi:predicted RNA-binding protein YlxR (DUF448 family)
MVRRADPVRTCVGCRKRAPASQLLRVAVPASGPLILTPDPARRLPGRGAYLHVQPDCLAQALRRRAFGRALRVEGAIEVGVLATYLEKAHEEQDLASADGEAPKSPPAISKVGRPE